jgi:long-subunit fatty acid transport protein
VSSRRVQCPLVLCATLAAWLAATRDAAAGIEDTFALGPGPMALAGSYAARPGDFAASYYNPAGLAPGGRVEEKGGFFEASIALVYGHPSLFVARCGSSSAGCPSLEPLSTHPVDDTAGAVVGARFSVGQPFHVDGLDMGLAVYLPGHIFEWSIQPDDKLQWSLLTDRTQVLTANVALAYRVQKWLSLGVGLRVAFDVQTNITGSLTHVDILNYHATSVIGTDSTVYGRVAPAAGVLLTPLDGLRVGLSYRGESYVDDWGSASIATGPQVGLGNLGYNFRFAHYFEPTELTAAVGADVGGGVDISADLTYARWSDALSTNRNTFGCGLTPCDGASPIWGDTWTPAFGVRWRATRAFALMAGYRYQKSPIDNFGGPSNLLDNDRHVPSTGFELDLSKLVPSLDARIKVGLQYVLLVNRYETKEYQRFSSDAAWQSNPGYPSYGYGGHLLGGSVGVEARW